MVAIMLMVNAPYMIEVFSDIRLKGLMSITSTDISR